MKWLWNRKDDPDNINNKQSPRARRNIYSLEYWTDPQTYLTPEVLLPASVVAASVLGLIHFYTTYVRRIPEPSQIYPSFFRKRSLFGKVTSVGDGDNFRLYHTPGGRLLGWGWLRGVPTNPKELRDRTLHIRIAGVDAPEGRHFGNPAQPHSAQSLQWLTNYILGKRVRAYIYRRDQYERVVGSVKIWKGCWPRDLGLEMLKAGVAQVYESKFGAEFGNMEVIYRQAEAEARVKRIGMWGVKGPFQSPGEYKKALREAEFFTALTTRGSGNAKASTTANTTGKVVAVEKPKSAKSTTAKPTIAMPTTAKPTTVKPTTVKPTTVKPTTVKPTTAKPTAAIPTTAMPTTAKPMAAKLTRVKPTRVKPTTVKPTIAKPTTAKPTAAKSATSKHTTAKSTTAKPTSTKPPTTKSASAAVPRPTMKSGTARVTTSANGGTSKRGVSGVRTKRG